MKITPGPLSGLLMIEPRVFRDERGYFYESCQNHRYQEAGIPALIQDNISRSYQNSLRGLHYQLPNAQGKLIWVLRGKVWDVMVDIRRSSPTFGKWHAVTLSDENPMQIYIPPGFAHGFCVLSEVADFAYKCSDYYTPSAEHGISWDDPTLAIEWPVQKPILSPKDQQYPRLNEITHDHLFS